MIENVLLMIAGYLGAGVLAAALLHAKALPQIDPGTQGAGWFFRVLVTPGLVALWPLMLLRWARASKGPLAVDAENVASARSLRKAHGFWIQLLAVLVPVAAGAALASRRAEVPPEPSAVRLSREAQPLPDVVKEMPGLFGEGFAMDARLRGDGQGARQIELTVHGELSAPKTALFWKPEAANGQGLSDAVFLGLLRGPGVHRFGLPAKAAADGFGSFHLWSLGHGEALASAKPSDSEGK